MSDSNETPYSSKILLEGDRKNWKKELELILSQCGPQRDSLKIENLSNTWCHVFQFQNIDIKKLILFGQDNPVIFPWESKIYNTARLVYNKSINVFPSLIVMASEVEHIQRALTFATKHKIPISVRGGSHSTAGFSLTSGIVIDVSRMNNVRVFKNDKLAAFGAGCKLGHIIPKLAEDGYIVPSGTCVGVGISGLQFGGGFGYYMRKYGLTCDNLLSVKMVLADGRIVKANEEENKDLFWALRGSGGGNFGIGVRYIYKIHSVQNVLIFSYSYSWEKAKKAIKIFQKWAPFADESLTVEMILKGPLNGGVIFNGQFTKPKSKKLVEEELAHLDSLGEPYSKILKEDTVIDAARNHADNNIRPGFQQVKSCYVYDSLKGDGIDILVSWAGKIKANQASNFIGFAALGGKVSQVNKNDTAFFNRNAIYWIEIAQYFVDAADEKQNSWWASGLFEEIRPYASPYCYVNFPDLGLKDWENAYWGPHYKRLQQIKQKYDPNNIFNLLQGVRLPGKEESYTHSSFDAK